MENIIEKQLYTAIQKQEGIWTRRAGEEEGKQQEGRRGSGEGRDIRERYQREIYYYYHVANIIARYDASTPSHR
jgi:hypothetical protein